MTFCYNEAMQFDDFNLDNFDQFNLHENKEDDLKSELPTDAPEEITETLNQILSEFSELLSSSPEKQLQILMDKYAEAEKATEAMWEELVPLYMKILRVSVSGPRDDLDMELVNLCMSAVARECSKRQSAIHIDQMKKAEDLKRGKKPDEE